MSSIGINRSYKIATNAFVANLIDFADKTKICSKKMKISTIATMDTLIEKIVQSTLPTDVFTSGLASALKACKLAIKLRERMQLFFTTRVVTGDANDTHIYFIDCLKRWYVSLRGIAGDDSGEAEILASAEFAGDADAPSSSSSNPQQNRFDAFSDEDAVNIAEFSEATKDIQTDYFDMISEADVKQTGRARMTPEEIKKCFFDELFFTVSCLFTDLDSLYEKVSLAWMDVKKQKLSVIAATSVTLTAFRFSNSLEAEFQLKYPAVNSLELLYTAVLFRMNNFESLVDISQKAWTRNQKRFEFHYGSLLHGMKFIGFLLGSFGDVIKNTHKERESIPTFFKRGAFGPSFHEDNFPLVSFDTEIAFLMEEVTALKNFYYHVPRLSMVPEGQSPSDNMSEVFFSQHEVLGIFVNQFKPLFEKKSPPISTVFAMCCWLKCVRSTQGQRFISRTFSLTKFAVMNVAEIVTEAFDGCRLTEIADEESMHKVFKLV